MARHMIKLTNLMLLLVFFQLNAVPKVFRLNMTSAEVPFSKVENFFPEISKILNLNVRFAFFLDRKRVLCSTWLLYIC